MMVCNSGVLLVFMLNMTNISGIVYSDNNFEFSSFLNRILVIFLLIKIVFFGLRFCVKLMVTANC